MVDIGRASALLFESGDMDERLSIVCYTTDAGGLVIERTSDGDLTQWSFEESPHVVKTCLDVSSARALVEYYHLDEVDQVPAMLRLEFVGFESDTQIRALLKRHAISYTIQEAPIAR